MSTRSEEATRGGTTSIGLQLMTPPSEEVEGTPQALKTKTADDKKASKLKADRKEYRKTLLIPHLIYSFVFIDFYLAVMPITNMAENVPSFENEGAFWFTDLTTPDATFILPILTILAHVARHKVLKWPSSSKQGLMVTDVTSVLCFGVLFSTSNFPQALYCHWIASSVFECCYFSCINLPGVRKALGFPEESIPGRARKP